MLTCRGWAGRALTAAAGIAAMTTVVLAQAGPAGTGPVGSAPAVPVEKAKASPAAASLPADQASLQKTWEEFRYYVRIGREDAARSFCKALAESPAEDRDLYLVLETADTESLLTATSNLSKELADLVLKLRRRVDRGFESVRREPGEIAKQIEHLGGTSRAYAQAIDRLKLSGEYALPQLLAVLADPKAPDDLKEKVRTVLPKLGKEAVRGLSAALASENPQVLEAAAQTLVEMPYPQAAPALRDLLDRKNVLPGIRNAAREALIACAGPTAMEKPVAELYYEWASNYYSRYESLRPDPRFDTANVWFWKNNVGLRYVAVPSPIFCDVYAMQYALLALERDPTFYPAVPLWISANLDKEANLPAGASDPTRGADQPPASFYALAASASFLQDVLAKALAEKAPDVNNSAVAIGAIRALSKTAGAKNLVAPLAGGAQPLVKALSDLDRNVRFLAAISLANALPQDRFEGCDQVLWVLGEALRQTGKKSVLMVASQEQTRNALKDAIRAAGYEPIDEPDAQRALGAARGLGNVDVVVLTSQPAPADIIAAMRSDPLLVTMPVVAISDAAALAGLAAKDDRLIVLGGQFKPDAVAEALGKALQLGVGKPMTPEEAAQWSIQAAKAVRKLGETRNQVFDISRMVQPLVVALGHAKAEVRVAAAEALAVLKDPEAQRAIAGLANGAGEESLRVAAYNGLAESLRLFGNQLTEELAQGVVDVVKAKGSQPLREAAAQALGAMNLPSQKISSLLIETAWGLDGEVPPAAAPASAPAAK